MFASIVLIIISLSIAITHIYWGMGGRGGEVAIPKDTKGTPLFKASPLACYVVAICFILLAAYVYTYIEGTYMPPFIKYNLKYVVTALFVLRAIGDFKYVGFFKRVRGTNFAKWDNYLFSPLCLVIAYLCFQLEVI